MIRWLVVPLMLACTAAFATVEDTCPLTTADMAQHYRQLTTSLRCPKCQNSSIADSQSAIATDMRMKVCELLHDGQSPQQIRSWMIARYGNFVSYQPPVTPSTLVLWLGPVLFILIGAAIIVQRSRKRRPEGCGKPERHRREGGESALSPVPGEDNPAAKLLRARSSLWPGKTALLTGGALLLVAMGLYLKIGGLPQVLIWRQITSALPALRAQMADPAAPQLTAEQLARLALGLRSELERDPANFTDWMLLGRLGKVLNNDALAKASFGRAWTLRPNDSEAIVSYVGMLVQSDSDEDRQRAASILQNRVRQDDKNVQLLSLLAFNAFGQGNYSRAIDSWDKMLTLMPADDIRVEVIQRSIQQARKALRERNPR